MTKKIAILGAGAFGTALSCVISRKGENAVLWGRDAAIVDDINNHHKNSKYLRTIKLQENLTATTDFSLAVDSAEIILLVTPAQSIGHFAEKLAASNTQADIVLCAKGIDKITGQLPTQTLRQKLPEASISSLSGPSFSTDIAKGLPTAVTLANTDMNEAIKISAKLSDPSFRLYASDDPIGVELGGALKNVIALAIGVCRGMQLGASAEAALIARGFSELTKLSKSMGANEQTLTGLSGLGDLVLTCSTTQSRNFSYGIKLGLEEDTSNLPLAEGAHTASIASKIAKTHGVECPIIETVAKLVSNEINVRQAVEHLMQRPLKQENV